MEGENKDQGGAGQSAEGASVAVLDNFELLVGGEKSVVDRAEAVRLAQMGLDYTKKTQSLASEREKFAEQVEQRAQEIYREARKRSEEETNTNVNNDANKDPEVSKKLADLEAKFNSIGQESKLREAEVQLDGIMSNLRKKYEGLTDEDEALIMLRFNKEANPEADSMTLFDTFAKERAESRSKMRQEIIDGYVKTKTRNPFASGESGKSGATGTTTLAPAKTFEEARERAEARLKADSGY